MITLCVPTKDRAPFVERLLRYYGSLGYPHPIFIGDSSEGEHRERNRSAVAGFARQLNAIDVECPGLSSCETIERLNQAVTTPYCAFLGDDDFLCPTGLQRSAEFLAAHPDYGAAHGRGLIFQMESNKPYGVLGNVGSYPQAVLEEATGAGRLRELFTVGPHALLNSVHRTEIWQAMFRGTSTMRGVQNRNVFKDELMATGVSAVRGKVQQLDVLYLIRQSHTEDSYRFPHVFDWLTDAEWLPSYQVFQARLIEELARQDGLGEETARGVVREVVWIYLAKLVVSARRREAQPTRRPAQSRLRVFAKRLPGLRLAWRRVQGLLERCQDELSLQALLNPASTYHEEFIPIYRLLTSAPSAVGDGGRQEGRPRAIALAGADTERG